MRSRIGSALLLVLVPLLAACGSDGSPAAPGGPGSPSPPAIAGFEIRGDPAGATGATWVYRGTANGIAYDLEGVLFKPPGAGPFPAVIVSHGVGGNVNTYARPVAAAMVGWGAVVIATNYTHSGGVPVGSPGTADEPGASAANVARARRLLDLLRSLGYVDMNRVAAHGHSGGAFVTTALVGAEPAAFRAASHTAGGIRPDIAPPVAQLLPSVSQASPIRAPYQMHHGDQDDVVPLIVDQLLQTLLADRGVTHELVVYPGMGHNDVASSPVVYERIRTWYRTHGVL